MKPEPGRRRPIVSRREMWVNTAIILAGLAGLVVIVLSEVIK
jgi:hypothetical protein